MNERADVVIVGGGVVGSSIALHVRERLPGARVLVVERDPTYARASSRLATGGIRQQYGSPVNVSMAQHSIRFYAGFDERARAAGCNARAWFRQRGYLFLASEDSADALALRFERLCASGARVERWSQHEVRSRVPGLVCDDVPFAVFGPDDGYLDPREVLSGFRQLAECAGAEYVHGTVVGVERRGGRVAGVELSTGSGHTTVDAPVVVNAAGAYARSVGEAAGLHLPIDPVRQHLFRLELADPLPSRIPMIFDPGGTHWRLDDPRTPDEAERLVVGRSRENEPVGENFECDSRRLHEEMLPALTHRYPAARIDSVVESWAGLYEMSPDHNALLGEHPGLPGFIIAAGFSGHGLMMAPATGVAVADLLSRAAPSFDIRPLAPDRFDRGVYFEDGALI